MDKLGYFRYKVHKLAVSNKSELYNLYNSLLTNINKLGQVFRISHKPTEREKTSQKRIQNELDRLNAMVSIIEKEIKLIEVKDNETK